VVTEGIASHGQTLVGVCPAAPKTVMESVIRGRKSVISRRPDCDLAEARGEAAPYFFLRASQSVGMHACDMLNLMQRGSLSLSLDTTRPTSLFTTSRFHSKDPHTPYRSSTLTQDEPGLKPTERAARTDRLRAYHPQAERRRSPTSRGTRTTNEPMDAGHRRAERRGPKEIDYQQAERGGS
jgi:hypothetical protein